MRRWPVSFLSLKRGGKHDRRRDVRTGQFDRAVRTEHHPGVLQNRKNRPSPHCGMKSKRYSMSTAMRKQGIKHIDTAPLAERYGTILWRV